MEFMEMQLALVVSLIGFFGSWAIVLGQSCFILEPTSWGIEEDISGKLPGVLQGVLLGMSLGTSRSKPVIPPGVHQKEKFH